MGNKAISSFKEMPKTKVAWWAMVLGLASVLEIPLLVFINSIIRKLTGVFFAQSIGITGIVLTVTAIITGTIAYRKSERSWILWLGFGPAIALGLFWLIMIIAEIFSIIFGLGF